MSREFDPGLLAEPVGVYPYRPEETIGKLIVSRVGIGVYSQDDLEEITAGLEGQGFVRDGDPPNRSISRGDATARPGELHRHDDISVIVHQTETGTGTANYFWAVDDADGYDPYFELDPAIDPIRLSAEGVELKPGRVIVFPANTWHQFGVNPNQTRQSHWKHYYPQLAA